MCVCGSRATNQICATILLGLICSPSMAILVLHIRLTMTRASPPKSCRDSQSRLSDGDKLCRIDFYDERRIRGSTVSKFSSSHRAMLRSNTTERSEEGPRRVGAPVLKEIAFLGMSNRSREYLYNLSAAQPHGAQPCRDLGVRQPY